MLFIILSIVVTIGIFIICGMNVSEESWKMNPKQCFALFGLLALIPGFFARVPANSVGIQYSIFTGTRPETLNEGIHTKSVLDKVYCMSTEVQTVTVEAMTSQTKDAQFVSSDLDIKYRVNPSNAYIVFKQFKTLKNLSETMVAPTVQRVLELVTTKYNVIDVLGERRNEIYVDLEKNLSDEFAKYGIDFCSVSILDMDAGEAIENAITQEAVAKKAVETAEQELLKAQTEAKKKSVTAQAEQDAARIQAETKIIQAEADNKANVLLNQSLTRNLLDKQWIDKWNGVVPLYYGGESGLILNAGEQSAQ